MSSHEAPDLPIGRRLYEQGWRQGSLFRASSLRSSWNDLAGADADEPFQIRARKANPQASFVLITQECDIIAEREQLVEALACKRQNPAFTARVQRNSPRWFVVDPAIDLVASAMHRMQLSKAALATIAPQPWPAGEERLRQFVDWLGRRYTRPAMPDAMVDGFQRPLEEAVQRLFEEEPAVATAFNHAVRDLRVSIPATENPPYDLSLVLLTQDEELTEQEADSVAFVLERIKTTVDPELVRFGDDFIANQDEMPLRVYTSSWPVYLEYLSYEGEETNAAPPLRVP